MLWQGAKWRILKNFNVQNEECHNYGKKCLGHVDFFWNSLDIINKNIFCCLMSKNLKKYWFK
jgi:hypothetical protein